MYKQLVFWHSGAGWEAKRSTSARLNSHTQRDGYENRPRLDSRLGLAQDSLHHGSRMTSLKAPAGWSSVLVLNNGVNGPAKLRR